MMLNISALMSTDILRVLGEMCTLVKVSTENTPVTSLESDKPWPGSPFSVFWFKTRPGELVVPDPF